MTIENLLRAKRICIIGSPGSGKSTLGSALARKLTLPLIRMSDVKNDMTKSLGGKINTEESLTFIADALSGEKWITDGVFTLSLDIRFEKADIIIFLDMPMFTCLKGVIKRGGRNLLGLNSTAHADYKTSILKRLEYFFSPRIYGRIINFHTKRRPFLYDRLKRLEYSNKVIIIKSRVDVNKMLNQISNLNWELKSSQEKG